MIQKSKPWLITGFVSAVALILLTGGVVLQLPIINHFDANIQTMMIKTVTNSRTQVMEAVTFFGSPAVNIVLIILIAIALWLNRQKLLSIWIICVQLSGSAIALLIKEVVHRARPNFQILKDTGFSLPSGHTFNTAILVLTILFVLVPLVQEQEVQLVVSLLSIVWFCVVAFSRVYLRDHFPTDIIASLLLALAWWEVMRIVYILFNSRFRFLKNSNRKEAH